MSPVRRERDPAGLTDLLLQQLRRAAHAAPHVPVRSEGSGRTSARPPAAIADEHHGEPVVDGPCADVAARPSLTIEATLFFSDGSMPTRRCTVTLPPVFVMLPAVPLVAWGTVNPDQVTTPFAYVPPLSAETKLVLAGSGSVRVTPVASALPMFLSVIE